jgi:hypothetical protein
MSKNDYIINLYFDYLPYFYDGSLSISELELDKDYRVLAQELHSSKSNIISKINYYRNKGIPPVHLSNELKNIDYKYQEYFAWAGLQIFYKNNKDTFFNGINSIDLHGLYSTEAIAILKVIFTIKKGSIKIITGRGKGILFNITERFLIKQSIKYTLSNNCFLIK